MSRLPPMQEACFFLLVAVAVGLFVLYEEKQKRSVKK